MIDADVMNVIWQALHNIEHLAGVAEIELARNRLREGFGKLIAAATALGFAEHARDQLAPPDRRTFAFDFNRAKGALNHARERYEARLCP